MDDDFFAWAAKLPPTILTQLYELWSNKPRGSQLIGVTGVYGMKKITTKEIKEFSKVLDGITSFKI